MECAIPFITYNSQDNKFTLSKEAETFLNNHHGKVGVVSVVGKYRTGKSFFVNRVLLNKGKNSPGFKVGPSIHPCTKGLWIWNRPLKPAEKDLPTPDDMSVLLIDCEGFGGCDENTNQDTRIFLFALLLSSYLIYNCHGAIDENALQNISLIVNLAKDIRRKSAEQGHSKDNNSKDDKEDLDGCFPNLLWVLRDFALKLVDANGNPITSMEYLEQSLALQKGSTEHTESKNRLRRHIKAFFKDRDCVTLIRPVESEKDLQKLDNISDEQLRPEFVSQMYGIRQRIFNQIKPKTSPDGRTKLTGPMLVELCKCYLETINNGCLPTIENAWTYVVRFGLQKARDEALNLLTNRLADLERNSGPPVDTLKDLKHKLKQEVMTMFKKQAIGTEANELAPYLSELETKFEETYVNAKATIKKSIQFHHEAKMKSKTTEILKKLHNGEFTDLWAFKRHGFALVDELLGASKSVNKETIFSFTETLLEVGEYFIIKERDKQKPLEAELLKWKEKANQPPPPPEIRSNLAHEQALMKQIQELREQLGTTEENAKVNEEKLKASYANRLSLIEEELEIKREEQKNYGEWQREQIYLENEISFLKGQLEESSRLHDALLQAVQRKPSNLDNAFNTNLRVSRGKK